MPKFNNKYKKLVHAVSESDKRLLPKLEVEAEKRAYKFIELYQGHLIKNDLRGIEPLSDRAVQAKTRAGISIPQRPLMAGGLDKKNSYVNNLQVSKIRKNKRVVGAKVTVRRAKHWLANMTLQALFVIHEKGALIQQGRGFIRIPPRPVFALTEDEFYKKTMSGEFGFKAKLAQEMRDIFKDFTKK